jgi:hypothetical protein
MRRFLPLALLLAAFPSTLARAQAPDPASATTSDPAPNYADPSAWACRPGNESICTANLDAIVLDAAGHRSPQHFTPAANPPIDCFYIYPTVSLETTDYADLTPTPEVRNTINAQVGRLSSRCRVYAPLYRQFTLKHLRDRLSGTKGPEQTYPSDDVAAAWAYYLAHDNHGRGVVIVGHSQGTILLQALIAKSIDGTPAQSLLVSAFLAGDPSLGVPPGKLTGGTFAHIPLCSSAAETGCAYVWSSYLVDDTPPHRVFAHKRTDGLESACVSPAAPSGGTGALKVYLAKPSTAPDADPPWIEYLGQFTGTCTPDDQGSVLRVAGHTDALTAFLRSLMVRPGWGLHGRDVSLEQGNILDVLDAEIATWQSAAHHHLLPVKTQ